MRLYTKTRQRTYRQRLIKHPHQFSCEEPEDSHFPVRGNGGHFLAVGGECKAGGVRLVLCKFIQVCVCFVLPIHVFGEFEFIAEAGPVFYHSRFVRRNDDLEFGVQADLGQRGGVHLVEDV